ncbi:Hypothetical predicted protein, partial [Scomber scombrus]
GPRCSCCDRIRSCRVDLLQRGPAAAWTCSSIAAWTCCNIDLLQRGPAASQRRSIYRLDVNRNTRAGRHQVRADLHTGAALAKRPPEKQLEGGGQKVFMEKTSYEEERREKKECNDREEQKMMFSACNVR